MIYFDNASTSFPKAPLVSSSIKQFIDEGCFNINRGYYSGAKNISELVFETREMLADFFNAGGGKNIIFSGGLTQSVNMALKGILKSGDRVLTSSIEHNAVMRPLKQLEKQGVTVDCFKCDGNGEADLQDFETKIALKPKMLIVTHASNVCGTVLPLEKLGEMCRRHNVLFAVDCAQTAGVIEIDVKKNNIDILCFTGHKGLLTVQGIGGMVLSAKAAEAAEPIISGGTGSFSNSTEIPRLLPDKFEAGTLNLPGIVGLNSSLKHINEKTVAEIFRVENELQTYFEKGIENIKSIRAVGAKGKLRCAVTSLDFSSADNGEIAWRLDEEFGIMTRSGLHCAPMAHKTLGTYPKGTVRFSFGHTNTFAEIDLLLEALKKIIVFRP